MRSWRQVAQQRAQSWLDKGCVILDVETTGLSSHTDEIIQIGLLRTDGTVMMNTYLKPSRPIDVLSKAYECNKIGPEKVEDAPFFEKIFPNLRQHIQGRAVIAYNAPFDRRMVEGQCIQLGLTPPTSDWQCAMEMYGWFRKSEDFQFTKGGKQKTRISLPGATHGALEDCQATLRLIQQIAEGRDPETGELLLASSLFGEV